MVSVEKASTVIATVTHSILQLRWTISSDDLFLQNGITPVWLAAEKGNSSAVKLLMDNGADITIADKVTSLMKMYSSYIIIIIRTWLNNMLAFVH